MCVCARARVCVCRRGGHGRKKVCVCVCVCVCVWRARPMMPNGARGGPVRITTVGGSVSTAPRRAFVGRGVRGAADTASRQCQPYALLRCQASKQHWPTAALTMSALHSESE